MSWLRWLLIAGAVLLVLVVGTLALLPQLLDTPTMQGYIAQTASHAVGRPVKFTSVSVSLLPLPHVNLKGLEIADDPRFGTTPRPAPRRGAGGRAREAAPLPAHRGG